MPTGTAKVFGFRMEKIINDKRAAEAAGKRHLKYPEMFYNNGARHASYFVDGWAGSDADLRVSPNRIIAVPGEPVQPRSAHCDCTCAQTL